MTIKVILRVPFCLGHIRWGTPQRVVSHADLETNREGAKYHASNSHQSTLYHAASHVTTCRKAVHGTVEEANRALHCAREEQKQQARWVCRRLKRLCAQRARSGTNPEGVGHCSENAPCLGGPKNMERGGGTVLEMMPPQHRPDALIRRSPSSLSLLYL